MKFLLLTVLVVLGVHLCSATIGVFLSSQQDQFQCMTEQGIQYQASVAVYGTSLYNYALVNALVAQHYNISSNIALQPSINYDPAKMIADIQYKIPYYLFQSIYVGPQYFSSSQKTQNCDYLKKLIPLLAQAYPYNQIYFYSSQQNWDNFLGSVCDSVFTSLNLSYISQNNVPTFSDYPSQKFGGWAAPYEKQWASITVCGVSAYMLYKAF